MGIAGISHCKMRSCLFCDQNRQLIFDLILSGHHISCGIGANSKFSDWQHIMMEQNIVPDIFPVLFFFLKIAAGIILYLSIFKLQGKIPEFQSV